MKNIKSSPKPWPIYCVFCLLCICIFLTLAIIYAIVYRWSTQLLPISVKELILSLVLLVYLVKWCFGLLLDIIGFWYRLPLVEKYHPKTPETGYLREIQDFISFPNQAESQNKLDVILLNFIVTLLKRSR